jgi:hypothetical protein
MSGIGYPGYPGYLSTLHSLGQLCPVVTRTGHSPAGRLRVGQEHQRWRRPSTRNSGGSDSSRRARSGPSTPRTKDATFTAEKDEGSTRHIVARTSLKTLLDWLDEIEAG